MVWDSINRFNPVITLVLSGRGFPTA